VIKALTTTIFIITVNFLTIAHAETDESKIIYTVNNGDTQSMDPDSKGLKEVKDKTRYDVIIVGGGLAGLTSAVYLTDHHKKVLLLEKESQVGGLASGGVTSDGIKYDRGAAYWTDTYPEEKAILKRIKLGDFKKKDPIKEPADTYFLNGKLYAGIWEEKTMALLPASFALFKYELSKENDEDLIPNQPLEAGPLDLDSKTASQWINEMPQKMADRLINFKPDPKSTDAENAEDLEELREIMQRFNREKGSLLGTFKMDDVLKLMDLYCRSALGTNADGVSALAFANFYISEIDTRYTTEYGTAQAAINMDKILKEFRRPVKINTKSAVSKIWDEPQGVRVQYINKGKLHEVTGSYLVFAAQIKLAPKLIDNFATLAPEKAQVINGLEYANYSVHTVNLNGNPYRLSYDTWTRPKDYTDKDFTDVILAQWIHTKGFTEDTDNQNGIWTIYHPVSPEWKIEKYDDTEAVNLAKYAVHRLLELYSPMVKQLSGSEIDITSVQTNRWPISVHIATPGHFAYKAKILRQPVGHIYFGNNNMGTPAFEEALFRGHCAADNILIRSDSSFNMRTEEPWSQCPIEK